MKSAGYLEFARIPPDLGSGVDHDTWALGFEEGEDRIAISQVQLGGGASDEALEPLRLEPPPDRRPDEPEVPGHVQTLASRARGAGRMGTF